MLFFSRRIERHARKIYAETFLVLVMLWMQILRTSADVLAISPQNVTRRYASLPSSFGSPLPPSGMEGLLVMADPPEACAPIINAPTINNSRSFQFIALIKRGTCDFDRKVLYAQQADYRAAIVYNDDGDSLTPMGSNKYGNDVIISSVFVGLNDGLALKGMNYTTGYTMTLLPNESPSWAYYFLPFISITSTCLLFFVMYAIAKYVRDQRRRRRARLSRDHLKKLPTKKFKKGDEYDVCAICLDDYEEGQKLRILPCNHAFHCKCVDPWLTNNRRTCPICKRKVIPPGMADSDEDSDSENGDGPNENTPLLAGMESDGMSEHGAVGGRSETTTPPPSPVPSNGDDEQGVPVVTLVHVESDTESGGSIPMEETSQQDGVDVTTSGSHTTTGSVTVHSENELEVFPSKQVKV